MQSVLLYTTDESLKRRLCNSVIQRSSSLPQLPLVGDNFTRISRLECKQTKSPIVSGRGAAVARGLLWPSQLSRLLSGRQVGHVRVLGQHGAALGGGEECAAADARHHSHSVSSVVFSLDGRSVVSGSYDVTARLSDVAANAPLQALEGDSGDVKSVAFSPDVKVLDTLLLSDNLVKEGKHKLIWIHPDHRGRLKEAHIGTVVLAPPSGRILIMRFKSRPKVI